MGKRETKQTLNKVSTDQDTAQNQATGLQGQNEEETRQAGGSLGGDRESVESGYHGLMSGNNPGVGDTHTERVGGKIDSGRSNDVYNSYMGLASDGGYSDGSRANIMGDISGLRGLGATGGIDSESANRFRGNGVYDEFANTGGLSLGDRANIKARALSPISSYATGTRDELARRRSVQGGFAPGFDSSSRALQRDTARNMSSTALDANLGIMDRVNQGRQWGAEGMSNSEGNLQGLRTGNMYRGLMGASGQEMNMNNSIASNKLGALGGARGAAGDIAGIEGQNIGNDFRNAENGMQTQRFNAGLQEGNINRNIGQQNLGLAGMNNLYSGDTSRYENALDRGGNIYGQRNNTNLGYYGARNPLATQPGIGGNIMGLVGSAAGVGAAMYGGGGRNANALGTPTVMSNSDGLGGYRGYR